MEDVELYLQEGLEKGEQYQEIYMKGEFISGG